MASREFEVGPGQTSAVRGKVRPIEGIRPGAVAVSWYYGHWAYGARDVEIDGERINGKPRGAAGWSPIRRCWWTATSRTSA